MFGTVLRGVQGVLESFRGVSDVVDRFSGCVSETLQEAETSYSTPKELPSTTPRCYFSKKDGRITLQTPLEKDRQYSLTINMKQPAIELPSSDGKKNTFYLAVPRDSSGFPRRGFGMEEPGGRSRS